MAAYSQLADNQMSYYQFKAKQILLQEKDEKEWQAFCKQIAPDCAACVAENTDVKECKDMGIQTFPKKPIFKTDKTFSQTNSKDDKVEILMGMKTRLEKIELIVSKLFEENERLSQKNVILQNKPLIQERSHTAPVSSRQQTLKPFEEQRKLQIQNDFKIGLQNSSFMFHKKSPTKKSSTLKTRNSGFFLPHDLEIKRAAARKAYLASLQTMPKVMFQNKKQISNRNVKSSQNKSSISPRKKISPKRRNQISSEDTEETLVKAFVDDDAKDENIEGLVDSIFEDLLREAALDLNKIKQKKREKHCIKQNEVESPSVPYNPSTSSLVKSDDTNIDSNTGIMKLKHFIDSFGDLQEEKSLRKKQIELVDKSSNTSNIKNSKYVCDKRDTIASTFEKKQEISETIPKFVCDVTNIIKIDPEIASNIISKRDRFWKYLENTSQTVKGNFNPWILNKWLAESILDNCINDIARELNELPSNFVQDFYNQEFARHVQI